MKPISAPEKTLILRTHRYFLAEAQQGLDHSKRAVRLRVHQCLGFGMATIARVVAAENKRKRGETTAPSAEPPGRLRETVEKYGKLIEQILTERNISGKPATSQHIADKVQELTGDDVSARTVRRTLRAMDCSFKVGERRDIRADNEANVAYRRNYLERKRANLNKRTAIRTEVFLDESYCNLHHVAQRTWLLPKMRRSLPSGKGRRFCIIGAGAITRVGNHRTRGEWVKGSVKVWAADKAASTSTDDYHGNFTSEKFERWFGQLCETLSDEYGECNIMMDGAKYHKRDVDAAPAKGKNKETPVKWLLRQGFPASMLMKKELQQLVEEKRGQTSYETVKIAAKWSHKVLFTPPYHPELQPIELIWAAIKNPIARSPCSTMAELEAKIHQGINGITSKTWVKAYRHVQNVEEYLEAAEPENESDPEIGTEDETE